MENCVENVQSNFIEDFITEDLENGVYDKVQTRFPPEPNGYLHIGHAKAICIDFGTAEKFNGVCNLRMDDTNPSKEDVEYVDAIKEDIEWLGFKWGNMYYASDYFDFIHECAVELIKRGKAYVCDFSADEISLLEENGAKIVSLGRRILRTETASIVSAGVVMQILEEI